MVPGEALSVEEAKKDGMPAASSNLVLSASAGRPSIAQHLLPELLAEIFLCAVADILTSGPDMLDNLRRSALTFARIPICISHVCRAWREAALSVRSLWSLLEIHTWLEDAGEGRVNRRCMKLFDMFMRRSRGVPLTIYSVIPTSSGPPVWTPPPLSAGTRPISFADILWALSKHQNRWQRVHIHYHEACVYPKHPFRELRLGDLSLLEELNLVLPFPLAPVEDRVVLDLSTCTRLRKLQLAGEVSIVSDGTLLNNLTDIDLTATDFMKLHTLPAVTQHSAFPTILDVLRLLELAPNLELLLARLAPNSDVVIDVDDEPSMHMVLPNLRRLILQAEGDENLLETLCFLLQHITVPNLSTLGLWCRLRRPPPNALADDPANANENNPNFADWWLDLPALLERSSFPPITSFYVDSDVISQREIRDCMHMFPHLHDLTLVHVPWSARGALRLALDPQKVNLAPALGVLRFIGVRFGGQKKLRMARIVKMVVSRWRDHGEGEEGEGEGEGEEEGERGQLKQVVFVGCDVAGLEEHPEIKKCVSEGLVVECRGCI